MGRQEDKFRRDLIERLAFEGPWGRSVAMRGIREGLGKSLGVTDDVLQDAAAAVRAGYRISKKTTASVVSINVFMQEPLGEQFTKLAQASEMDRGQLIKALLHAGMQTAYEPSHRAPRQWGVRGKKPKRPIGIGFQGKVLTADLASRTHFEVELSRGLGKALGRRAAVYGVTRSRYVLLWIADMVDGMLSELPILPVDTGMLFEDETGYVLPKIEGQPDVVLESEDEDADPDADGVPAEPAE